MAKYKLEYIWLDGYKPLASLRSKTQIKEFKSFPKLGELPNWGFDGSSTQQAEGRSSDCVLKPVAVFPDSTRKNGVLVMAEVMMPDGVTPHVSNSRATIPDDEDTWYGFEQEYFFYQDGRPLGFPVDGYPAPQGPYYTGVGYKNVGDIAREVVEKHIGTPKRVQDHDASLFDLAGLAFYRDILEVATRLGPMGNPEHDRPFVGRWGV